MIWLSIFFNFLNKRQHFIKVKTRKKEKKKKIVVVVRRKAGLEGSFEHIFLGLFFLIYMYFKGQNSNFKKKKKIA